MNHPAPDAVAALLELGAHLAAHPGRLPADLTPTDLTRALGHVRPTEHLVENATLATLGAARAHGLPWPHIGAALGLSDSGARDLYKRLRSRHPDYTEPLAPTLAAHRVRAAELLLAVNPLSPNARNVTAARLGAVLLAATLTRAPSSLVTAWLGQEGATLSGPLQALSAVPGDQAHRAAACLRDHAMDGPGTRADLVTYMRQALRESPWALTTAPAPDRALEVGATGAGAPLHTLEELDERARAWLRALPEPGEEADERAAARLLGAALFAALTFLPTLDEALAHVPHWLGDDTLTGPLAVLAVDLSPRTAPAREVLATHAETDAPTRARRIALMRAALEVGAATGPDTAEPVAAQAPKHTTGPGPAADGDTDQDGAVAGHHPAGELESTGTSTVNVAATLAAAEWPTEAAAPLATLLDALRLRVDEVPTQKAQPALALIEAADAGEPEPLALALHQLAEMDEHARAALLGADEELLDELALLLPDRAQVPPAPAPRTLTGYAAALVAAGLSPDAAAALATPLTEFVAAVTLAQHRQFDGQLRDQMHALAPTLASRRPGQVSTLLHTLPRLNLIGLPEWVALTLAIGHHAPQLEQGLDPNALTSAEVPASVATALARVVHGARPALLASWAPGAPAWEAGPALEQLVTAVDTGDTAALPAALDEVTSLRRVRLCEEGPMVSTDHSEHWERLVHTWRTHRARQGSGELAPTTDNWAEWRDKASAVFPQAAIADAVGHLLDAAGRPLITGALGDGETHRALDALRQAVVYGQSGSLGTILDDVLALKPTHQPLKDHPQAAAALTALISAYDNQ